MAVLRTLYDKLWLYHNFFLPALRLQARQYSSPFKYRRQFVQASPPFDRLKNLLTLPPPVLQRLETLRSDTNPLILRNEIGQLIDRLLDLPPLDNSLTVNVFETLIKEVDSSVTLSFEPTIALGQQFILRHYWQ